MTYIFEHIFKTAGTTFNLSYLPGAFQPDELHIIPGFVEPNRQDLDRLVTLPPEDLSHYKMIAGHNAHRLRPVLPKARWLTLVRDPSDRAISGYLHARFHPDAREVIGAEIQEKNIPLSQYIREDLHAKRNREPNSFHDWQAKLLLGAQWELALRNDKPAVKQVIQSRFRLVGYTEAFELFLFFLHVTEGFPLVLFNNRLVRKERATFQATAEDLATIERYSQADRVLYDCARGEFDRKVEEIWTTERSRLYENYLCALREFRQATAENMNARGICRLPGHLDCALRT